MKDLSNLKKKTSLVDVYYKEQDQHTDDLTSEL